MMRSFKAFLLCLALQVPSAAPSLAAPLTHGLLWRDSPLSAQFPLVVKTPPGRWFHLQLRDAATGQAVLAAGIEGGRFFRVLVPNGRYTLDLAFGQDWGGAVRGFAPGEGAGQLQIAPLDFAIRGVARKQGHVVELRPDRAGAGFDVRIHGQAVCQRIALEAVPDPDPDLPSARVARGLSERALPPDGWDLQIRRLTCD